MNSRVEFLIRRNKGQKLLPDYTRALSEITGINANLLMESVINLEASDDIYRIYISNIRSIIEASYAGKYLKTTVAKSDNYFIEIQTIAQKIQKRDKYYLVTKLSEFCGMIAIDFDVAISHFDKLISYDGDSIGLVSADASEGLSIDLYTDANKKDSYDFIAFLKS